MPTSLLPDLHPLLERPPYSLKASEKNEFYQHALSGLTRHHYEHCPEYRRIARLLGYDPSPDLPLDRLPFIPVRLFKEFDLSSVARQNVTRTITSSGTSGQAVSRIHLDKATAGRQTRVLVKIASSFTGDKRLPFLVIDSPAVLKDRALFSARGAGIVGFGVLGCDPTYLLDENFAIDFDRLDAFLEKHQGVKILLFGFTFVVWERLCQALERAGRSLRLEGILIHGGGWKKLVSLAVDNATFKATVRARVGISIVHNYYGMVEQAGSIFMECTEGVFHASTFSDIIVRDPATFAPLGPGRTGLIQLLSLLPGSYPGHSILTEDLGRILGTDDCPCGRMGTYFRVEGRVKDAEVRGCSDAYASH
jgi:hypothetical protein